MNIKNVVGSAADGAANMQGQYNGFMVYLTNASPEQIKVWCSAHVLNLVIQDSTSSVEESNLFSVLNSWATTIKESHIRMEIWREEAPDSRRLGNIGETRWWSKHDVLGKVYGKYGDSSPALFVCLIVTLSRMEGILDGDARRKVLVLKQRLLKFKSVLSV